MFESGHLVQALTGKDEEISVLAYFKALGHGSLHIQDGPPDSELFMDEK
jgi:hypothetical protein